VHIIPLLGIIANLFILWGGLWHSILFCLCTCVCYLMTETCFRNVNKWMCGVQRLWSCGFQSLLQNGFTQIWSISAYSGKRYKIYENSKFCFAKQFLSGFPHISWHKTSRFCVAVSTACHYSVTSQICDKSSSWRPARHRHLLTPHSRCFLATQTTERS
jgi:hypothetical protein